MLYEFQKRFKYIYTKITNPFLFYFVNDKRKFIGLQIRFRGMQKERTTEPRSLNE